MSQYTADTDEILANIDDEFEMMDYNTYGADKNLYNVSNEGAVMCINCSKPMQKSDVIEYTCPECGFNVSLNIDSEVSYTEKKNYNTKGNSTALYINGVRNVRKQNSLKKNNANYVDKQKRDTLIQLNTILRNEKGILTISKSIVDETADYFHAVQQHAILRSFNRIATMAACFERVSSSHGYPKKTNEVIEIFKIEPKDLSLGNSTLNELHSEGLLGNFKYQDDNRKYDFLKNYFKRLNIPDFSGNINYIGFCCDIIDLTEKYKIACNNILSTKCAGVIYILTTYRDELKYNKDDIAKECKISKTTFIGFSKSIHLLMENPSKKYDKLRIKIRNIFAKNNIKTKFKKIHP